MFHGRNLRKHRISQTGYIYSVTICTNNKIRYFDEFYRARLVINALKFQDKRDFTKTYAFVLMPDHLHWVFELRESSLDKIIHSVKSYTSHQVGFRLWQEGYYEHTIRSDSSLLKQSRYVVANPLRAGLVDDIGKYPHWDAVWLNGDI